MKLDLSFSQNSQKVDTSFNENKSALSSNFGELTVLHDGQNGATFTPNVSEDGMLSWTNDRELPNPEPVNIKGKDGKDGIDGKDGKNGVDGKNGIDGKDGYTPIKGEDYFTAEEVQEIAEQAAELVDIPEGGVTSWNDLTDKPDFAPIATSGSWNDLTDKPFGETLDYSTIIDASMGKFKFALLPDGRYSATANVGSISLVVGKNYRVEVSYMMATVYCKFEGVCVNNSGLLCIIDGVNYYSFDILSDNTTITCIPSIAGFENVATSPMLFVKIYEGAEDIIPLDEKYIPDTIARTEDILTEEDVTALINNALGVIENGTY